VQLPRATARAAARAVPPCRPPHTLREQPAARPFRAYQPTSNISRPPKVQLCNDLAIGERNGISYCKTGQTDGVNSMSPSLEGRMELMDARAPR
jgi:hypothetical protein